jgi:hypothetical protein
MQFMKNLFTTATAFLFLTLAVSAQTRKIAFESHGGNAENFALDPFNEESDFGLPANKTSYSVDSIIKLNPSRYVVVKRMYNKPWSDSSNNWKYLSSFHDTLTYDLNSGNSNGFPADSFRHWFKTWDLINAGKLNKVIFVGFDEKKRDKEKQGDKEKQQLLPLTFPDKGPGNPSPFDGQMLWMLTLLVALSLLGGCVSWKLYKPQVPA